MYDIISKEPKISYDDSDKNIIFVNFRGFPRLTARLQPNGNFDEFALLEKVNSLQNQLATVEIQLNKRLNEAEFEKSKSQAKLESLQTQFKNLQRKTKQDESVNYKLQMQTKLKYAISNATISGSALSCRYPSIFQVSSPEGKRWCSSGTGHWLYFKLKEMFTINLIRFRLYDRDNRFYTYNLAISKDGFNWRTLAAGKQGRSIQEFKLPNPIEIRYLRMSGFNSLRPHIELLSMMIDWI